MPLETCKLSRSTRTKICQEHEESAPSFGYYAAQKQRYYVYKLHAVCSSNEIIKMYDISKASAHDIHRLNEVKEGLKNCVLV